jgi:hypothetical protein
MKDGRIKRRTDITDLTIDFRNFMQVAYKLLTLHNEVELLTVKW